MQYLPVLNGVYSTIDRELLNGMILEQLKKEAIKYWLTISDNPKLLIDALMAHFERHGPGEIAQ